MNPQKHYRNDNLQKSSLLFLQLGLVLALFLVYIGLEYESPKKEFPLADTTPPYYDDDTIPYPLPPVTTRPNEDLPKPEIKKQIVTEIIIKPDDTPDFEKAIEPTDKEPQPTIAKQIGQLPGGDTLEPEPDDEIDFKIIEDAPVFPGCEGLTKEASKACFSKEISKFINKKFKTEIAESLNLSGKQKIWVEFKVDKTGSVTGIRARASHVSLEKEAIRVVQKLPQMIPGKQRLKPVNVKYTLPITFQIY